MKLTLAIFLATGLQVFATAGYPQTTVTLSERNASLEKIFRQIRKQTDFLFLYTKEVVQNAKKIDIVAKDATVEDVLAICFKDQPLVYTIVEKTVIIKQQEEKPHESRPPPIIVQGTITDSLGKPLAGVTILVKGTKTQGISDAGGNFKIAVPTANSVLVFSSIGYKTWELAVDGKNSVSVTLYNNPRELNEVVITGFGESRQKRSLGYSVTQVSGDDIRRANSINPIAALQGMVAGLQVTPGIGGPQGTTRFLIRGSASLDPYGNTPLVVVDDIIMDQDVILPNKGGDQDFGNILKDINPDDIESISVLKGGAVTALYGSKASNGVILIKTKKGFSQKGLGVSLAYSGMADKAYKTIDMQNRFGSGISADDWTTGPNGELQVDQGTYGFNFGPEMTGQTFRDISNLLVKNTPGKSNLTDLYRTGYTGNTNLTVSGGNEKTTFRFSYSDLRSKAITPNNNLDRSSFNLRATHRLAQRVLLDASLTYSRSSTLNPAFQNGNSLIYNYAYNAPRNYDTKYWLSHYIDSAKGGLNNNDVSTTDNAFWVLYQNKYKQDEDNLRGSINLKADLTNWLRFEGAASINDITTNYEAKVRGQSTAFGGGSYRTTMNNVVESRFRGNFNLTKKVSDFDLLLQLGGELNNSKLKGIDSRTNGFVLPDVFRLSNSSASVITTESGPGKSQTNSVFFQGSIGFRNYLTVNIYGRNDWNSTLVYNDGHGKYSYFYPGVDAAFVFTDAFKLPQVFDFGKLRLSIVKAGGGTSVYTANTGAYTANTPYTDAFGNSVINYRYDQNTLPNQNLVPVSNSKVETGLELKMLKNRLGADITLYQQDSKNQIINFGVPPESGVSNALINSGMVRNKGIEILLFGTPVKTRNFSWDISFNYTRNRNTIVSLPFGLKFLELDGGDGIRSVAQAKGDYGTIRSQYGMASYQAVDGTGAHVASALNGMPVVSINNSGLDGEPMVIYRRASNYNPTVGGEPEPVVGSILPKFLGGLRNTFNYKRISFGFFLDAKFGGDVYSTTRNYGSQTGAIASTLKGRTKDLGGLGYKDNGGGAREDGVLPVGVFRPNSVVSAGNSADGVSHNLSGMTVADAYAKGYIKPTSALNYYAYSYGWGNGIRTMSMVKSSWVSVREISLTYDLSSSPWLSKVKINGLRASLIARNLLFLHNSAPDHLNPDNLNSSSSGAFQESGGVPYVRSYGFSLNASF